MTYIVAKDRKNRRAIVIEVKRSQEENELVKDCQEAIAQIVKRQYAERVQMKGYRTILCYVEAFIGKRV